MIKSVRFLVCFVRILLNLFVALLFTNTAAIHTCQTCQNLPFTGLKLQIDAIAIICTYITTNHAGISLHTFLCSLCTFTKVRVRAGADEDVEAVMARLAAQSAENAALKERQAKLDKDQQVSALHPGCATSGKTCGAVLCFVMPIAAEPLPVCFVGCAANGRTCVSVPCLIVPLVAELVPVCFICSCH